MTCPRHEPDITEATPCLTSPPASRPASRPRAPGRGDPDPRPTDVEGPAGPADDRGGRRSRGSRSRVIAGVIAVAVDRHALRRSGPARAATAGPAAPAAPAPCPTKQPPALPAGETRTVTMNTEKGDDRHQARGRPVADRGRQLRGPRRVRVLRRRRLPPDGRARGRRAVRDPGRRPDGDRRRRPRVLRSRTRPSPRSTAAAWWRWPAARSPTRSGRSSSSSCPTRRATCSQPTTPTDHRPRDVGHGGRRRDLAASNGSRAARPTRSR